MNGLTPCTIKIYFFNSIILVIILGFGLSMSKDSIFLLGFSEILNKVFEVVTVRPPRLRLEEHQGQTRLLFCFSSAVIFFILLF